jgi:eukaryotic-like serine/threonine-protein kinase
MDRWEQIENAYHGARGLRGEERSRFLDHLPGLDRATRRQIEVLLAQDDDAGGLIDRPAVEWISTLTGRSIGPYDVLEPIGSGGMGHVYRARDRMLSRDVALKVLPAIFARDPDRLERFRREAQVLAALSHPNIAAIHGFEESGGVQALVLELVVGQTLADRIASGPIPIGEAQSLARQIADAIEAAHDRGVVHRDLKPANVKVRPDGTVKVLDFGLAKALEPVGSTGATAAVAPAVTSPSMIRMGVVLGTAAYMSPEQALGRPADKRSDIWAFGCVLYEMLTGKRAFEGEDVADTLTAVVYGAPDWTAWPDGVAPHIRALVEACLQKDRRQRIADLSTARFVMTERAALPAAVTSRTTPRQHSWKFVALAAAGAAVAGVAGYGVRLPGRTAATGVTRFSIVLTEDHPLSGWPSLTISPDGRQVIYAANQRLYLRSMSELDERPIAGTDSSPATTPVFSPDGQSIAFWSGAERAIKRVAVAGGTAATICEADAPAGMTWDADGLAFGQSQRGIMRVSADGGAPEVLVAVKPGEAAFAPQGLPGGRGTLFTLTSGGLLDRPRLVVQTSPTVRTILIDGASDGRYVPTGHIVYAVAGRLFAVSFDLRRLAVTSAPVPIVEGVARTALNASGNVSGMAQWSVSRTGSLVYAPGPATDSLFHYHLALLDATGRTERLPLPPDAYDSPRFSPDGRRVAFGVSDGRSVDVWIYDLAGTRAARRLTFGGRNRFPVWSPDGQRVAFQSDRERDLAIFSQRADSSDLAERLTTPAAGASHIPESWSPGGDVLAFSVEKDSRFSLWTLSLGDRRAAPLGTVDSEIPAASAFSPDGRWVAYQIGRGAGAGIQPATFVQPFPATGAVHHIASSGAAPLWSRDGRRLFYTVGPRPQWVAAPVTLQTSVVAGNPVGLPSGDLQVWRPDWSRQHDLSRDGRRVGLVASDRSLMPGTTRVIHVVLNWFEELEQRVPVK